MRTKSFINYYKVNVFLVFVFALFCISNDFYLVLEKLFVNTNTQTKGSFTWLSVSESTLKRQSIHSISDVINLSIVLKG